MSPLEVNLLIRNRLAYFLLQFGDPLDRQNQQNKPEFDLNARLTVTTKIYGWVVARGKKSSSHLMLARFWAWKWVLCHPSLFLILVYAIILTNCCLIHPCNVEQQIATLVHKTYCKKLSVHPFHPCATPLSICLPACSFVFASNRSLATI